MRNLVSSAALVAVLVAMGSGISVPKPRAGIAPDPLLRAIFVWRRLSLSTIVSPLRFWPSGPQPATVADRLEMSIPVYSGGREQQVKKLPSAGGSNDNLAIHSH